MGGGHWEAEEGGDYGLPRKFGEPYLPSSKKPGKVFFFSVIVKTSYARRDPQEFGSSLAKAKPQESRSYLPVSSRVLVRFHFRVHFFLSFFLLPQKIKEDCGGRR